MCRKLSAVLSTLLITALIRLNTYELESLMDDEGDGSHSMIVWGQRRTGTLTQGTTDGWGAIRFNDKSRYEGVWRDGNWTRGTWYQCRQDGTVLAYEGEWAWVDAVMGQQLRGWGLMRVTETQGCNYAYGKGAVVYEGQWERGNFHGKGTLKLGKNDVYIGAFENGKRSGNGTMFFRDGGSYIGEWRDDLFHGHGVRLLANGDSYIGYWDRGLEKDKKGWKVCHSESSKLKNVEAMLQEANGKLIDANAQIVDAVAQRNFAVSHLARVELILFYLKLGITVISVLAIAFLFTFYVKQYKMSKLVKERATEVENRFAQHILQHVQGGIWVKRLPQGIEKEVKITFMNNEFKEAFCCNCPLDKVVKISIQNQFGVDACHQEAYLVKRDGEELLPPLLTLSQCHVDDSAPCSIKVKMRPVPTVRRSDLTPGLPIGRGSYGRVFECEHKTTKEKFAVKELHGVLDSDYYIERFQREAETVAALEHPNIVKLIGTCPPASELWIVSELLGCNLRCLITKKNRLNIEEATAVSWGIAKGMEAIHRHNYMHRDLSSKNIVFDPSGIPKICDFGMAHEVVPRDDGMTFMPGTPFYMAPQMQTRYYTIAGDMWQFGILISEMICGEVDHSQLRGASLAENEHFLEEQQSRLSRSAKEEVSRLLKDPNFKGSPGISSLAEYLERRRTCLKKVSVELSPTSNMYPKTTHTLEKVVEWCLSVVEKERPPFNVIVQLLYCCLSLYYFESCPSPYNPDPAATGSKIPPAYESDIASRISACYSSLSPLTGREQKATGRKLS
ncbi:serine/threonine-protein kinase fused [Pelomyxa schiedti]|nr:serine/threonine-protein kinase fused [Pelomyxa schiedti]